MRDERFGDPDRFLDDEEADLWRPVGTMTTAPAVVATGEATLRAVAELMATEGVGAAVVAGPEGPVGIITERDVVQALADGADPDRVWAADVAAEDIMSADPEETVVTAIGIMADNGIRHLPIRDGGEIVGMVSARDLLRAVVDAAHR